MGLFDRLRGGTAQRVAFLGIDGVPYELIAEHPGVFSECHRIAEAGTAGRIESIVPPESSACWPALTTGVNPGKTGVYGFQDRPVGSYDTYIPMGEHVQAPRLWDRVTERGRAATVLNVPGTFPPQQDIQRMVSGFLSPSLEEAASSPAVTEILDQYGYRRDVDAELGHQEDKTAFMEDAEETLRARYRTFDHYVTRDDWDLFFGVFMTPDRVNHFCFDEYATDGPDADRFLEFYRQLDRYIGQLYDALPEDVALVVASDHGFTTLQYEVNCNHWLESQGYLSYATDAPGELSDISAETQVYSLIPGRFYINRSDREPRGCVTAAEYEAVREALISDLEALTGPDGAPVCADIYRGEDIYEGPATDIAPDVVVVPQDGFDLKAGFGSTEAVFTTGPRTGMHKFSNASLLTDNDQITIGTADLLDIAPTLADLLAVSVPESEFDGTSLYAG